MESQTREISKKSLITKARKLGINGPHKLSTKILINKVNRHNISKKVTHYLEKRLVKEQILQKTI